MVWRPAQCAENGIPGGPEPEGSATGGAAGTRIAMPERGSMSGFCGGWHTLDVFVQLPACLCFPQPLLVMDQQHSEGAQQQQSREDAQDDPNDCASGETGDVDGGGRGRGLDAFGWGTA